MLKMPLLLPPGLAFGLGAWAWEWELWLEAGPARPAGAGPQLSFSRLWGRSTLMMASVWASKKYELGRSWL